MLAAQFWLLACLGVAAADPADVGVISGTVVNGSQDRPCQTTVVLGVQAEGQPVSIRETTSDPQGRFRFEGLPLGASLRYQPGGQRGGVHYPGPRVALTPREPQAEVKLTVFDAVTRPSPLTLKNFDVLLCPEPGALRVTETLVVENASQTCYVGDASEEGRTPATLALNIPSDFERTTFQEEFYGRRFAVEGGKVVTGIPWPPGQRTLKYTYVLRTAQGTHAWRRPLDLPCAEVRLRVRGVKPKEIACNLATVPGGDDTAYASTGEVLPAGHVLEVTLGRLALPWTVRARWAAVGLLLALLTIAGVVAWRRRHPAEPATSRRAPRKAGATQNRRRPGRRSSAA